MLALAAWFCPRSAARACGGGPCARPKDAKKPSFSRFGSATPALSGLVGVSGAGPEADESALLCRQPEGGAELRAEAFARLSASSRRSVFACAICRFERASASCVSVSDCLTCADLRRAD
jgi:hypothetical protein